MRRSKRKQIARNRAFEDRYGVSSSFFDLEPYKLGPWIIGRALTAEEKALADEMDAAASWVKQQD